MPYNNIRQSNAMRTALKLMTGTYIDDNELNLSTLGDYFRKNVSDMSIDFLYKNETIQHNVFDINPKKNIGKWAFFKDVSYEKGIEDSFGLVVGARFTHNWDSTHYFIVTPQDNKIQDISNSVPYIFNMDVSIDGFQPFSELESELCSQYLNCYCVFKSGDEVKRGYINSFTSISLSVLDTDGVRHTIAIEDITKTIIEFKDIVEPLNFSVELTKNR